jgi:GrpB-like predicted nucleotidyltransferase (UPF0157 family)
MVSESLPLKKEARIPSYLNEYFSDIGVKHVVELREHNTRYKEIFSKESERIMHAFNQLPISLYHVGSTSVEALCAKPIIDMLLTYPDTIILEDIKETLIRNGYLFRKDLLPDRVYFVLEDEQGVRYFAITVCMNTDKKAREILTFRDNLRLNPSIREEYAVIKRKLSAKATNRKEYTIQKSEFIQRHSK